VSLYVKSLALENVGILRTHIDLGLFDPEITLITGANETGKSTAVEALRCALFEKHNAKHAKITALQPHGTSLAPEVWVEFELLGKTYRLHKRFLRQAEATLDIDGVRRFEGAAADDAVLQCLGAQPPGRQGSKPELMGLWGLLWVSQDKAASADPASQLGAETRGALQEAIGRLVGQVVGGRTGERLRVRIQEEASRYWTETTLKPTGELSAALDRREAARQRVTTLQTARAQVEDQAAHYASGQARLAELLREQPRLQQERARVEREAQQAAGLQAAAAKASQELEVARTREERARDQLQARRSMATRATELAARVAREAETLAELTRTQEARAATEVTAAAVRDQREQQHEAARAHRAAAEASLAVARQAVDAQRAAEELLHAREVANLLAQVQSEQSTALSDPVYRRLTELDGNRRALAAQLETEGTRLVVAGPEGPWKAAFGNPRTVEVPGLGPVLVMPARPGLSAARDRARDAASALAEALHGLSLETLDAARGRRAARRTLEQEARRLERALAELAPEGIATLTATVGQASTSLELDDERLKATERVAGRLAELRAQATALPIDEALLTRLNRLASDLEIAEARYATSSTSLELHALQGLEVAFDDEVRTTLAAGERHRWTLARPGRLRLGELAELQVVPGGEEVQEADVQLAAARRSLEEALGEAGAANLEAAREAARQREGVQAELRVAALTLQERAPRGLEALRVGVRQPQARHQALARRLTEARELAEQQSRVTAALEQNPLTETTLARLEELAAAQREARSAVDELAARLRLPGDEQPRLLSERSQGVAGGTTWELVPGEGGAATDATLTTVASELDVARAEAGVTDLATATTRWRAGLTLQEREEGLQRQLATLAPGGLAALEQQVQGIASELLTGPAPDLGELEAAIAKARQAEADAESELVEARKSATQLGLERAALEGELRGKTTELETLRRDLADAEVQLASVRAGAPDEELETRCREALQKVALLAEAARKAESAVEAAAPVLLEGELQRAQEVCRASAASEQKLRQELAALKALLDRAAAEGHTEQLAEAEAELAELEDQLACTQRAADAVRRLAEEVEKAWSAAQGRFLAPVIREARPYLAAIRPGTELRMTPDLAVDKILRRGTEEKFDTLSGGTREQLSVIVRLALAKVLAHDVQSFALPLILDDTMGWTDDGRFLSMVQILRNAAKEFQLIVLTCHPDRFARLQPGRTIELDRLRREAEGSSRS